MVFLINFLRLLQLVSRAVRLVIPWIQRQLLGLFVFFTTVTFGIFGNVPRTLRNIASEWRNRTQKQMSGVTEYDQILYWLFYVLALGMVVVGWVSLSWLTMFLVHLIF